jgi:hypothetical protein
MAILERLDAAINHAHSEAHEIIEIDITADDYAELMAFAAQFDTGQLEELRLDMLEQTYRGYPMVINRKIVESGIVHEEGAEALPNDAMAASE